MMVKMMVVVVAMVLVVEMVVAAVVELEAVEVVAVLTVILINQDVMIVFAIKLLQYQHLHIIMWLMESTLL